MLLMPSLGPMSIGVYEDNKGAIDLAKKNLSSSKLVLLWYPAAGDIGDCNMACKQYGMQTIWNASDMSCKQDGMRNNMTCK